MQFPAPQDTHPTKDEVADYLTAYAARFDLPVLLDCAVTRLELGGWRFGAARRDREFHNAYTDTYPPDVKRPTKHKRSDGDETGGPPRRT